MAGPIRVAAHMSRGRLVKAYTRGYLARPGTTLRRARGQITDLRGAIGTYPGRGYSRGRKTTIQRVRQRDFGPQWTGRAVERIGPRTFVGTRQAGPARIYANATSSSIGRYENLRRRSSWW